MASKFKVKQQAKREALCRKLVSSFLPGLQESDPANFNLAFSFIAQNVADPGRSLDVRNTDEWFDSLARRCDMDAQCAKAMRIRTLIAEIKHMGLGVKSDYEDVEYRILALLMLLSERPLDSSLDRATMVVRQEREQRLTEEAEAAAMLAREEAELLALMRAEASSDSDGGQAGQRYGRGGYGSSSSLSDWSEDERAAGDSGRGGHKRGAAATVGRGAVGGGSVSSMPVPPTRIGGLVALPASAQVTSPKPIPLAAFKHDVTGQLQVQLNMQSQLASQVQSHNAVAPDPPPSAGRQRLPPRRLLAPRGSLRARLVAAAGLPLQVGGEVTPLPRVLLGLLAALQGRGSEEIPWDPVKCSFSPSDDLYLAADVSYGAVRAAIRPLLRAATGIRRLDDWVQICLQRYRSGAPPAAADVNLAGSAATLAGRKAPTQAAAAAPVSAGAAGGGTEGSLEVPAWLLEAAGFKGRTVRRLVQGPTLQAFHQAVSSCLHALRTPLVELEQRVTSAAVAAGMVPASGNACWPEGKQRCGESPPLPSLYELGVSCQPYLRRAAGLVTAYLEVAKPLVVQLASAPSTAAWVAAAAHNTGDIALTPRLRSTTVHVANAAAAATGTSPSAAAANSGGGGSRSVALQLQAGLVLERLHAMNERGWLDGVFRPLESHAHRCMLLYLYLCALEPLLDGLAEWLWNSGTGSGTAPPPVGGTVPGSPPGGGGGSELPVDFFIARGGGPGREVPPDHPAFWREGYVALTRPPPLSGPGGKLSPRDASGSATVGPGSLGVASGQHGPSYLCPPFLEPLVPIIMAAGKSLRLRQREADSLEAAATTTAGAAGPGYGSAGSAVLDPVALEESYALYGLDPANDEYDTAGVWGGGGRDLKRGLMERLMSYITSPGLPGASAGLRQSAAQDTFWVPATPSTVAWQQQNQQTTMTPKRAMAISVPAAVEGIATGPMGPPASAGVSVSSAGGMATGGLWTRMATASSRLQALCKGEEGEFAEYLFSGRSGASTVSAPQPRRSTGRGNGDGVSAATANPGQEVSGMGAAIMALPRVRAPLPATAREPAVGKSSPVSPLDCGGGSGYSSPGDERTYRRQLQAQQNEPQERPAMQHQAKGDSTAWDGNGGCTGGDGGVMEAAELGGWWPRRCELLLRSAAGAEVALGSSSASHHRGPWNRIRQQLRAGPRVAVAGAPSSFHTSFFRPLPGLGPGGGEGWGCNPANAYQHPALDMLLMHACGRAPPFREATETGAAHASVWSAGTGEREAAPWSHSPSTLATPMGLPHPQELLRRGLVEPLQDRAYHVNDALLLKLLSGWGLEARLMALPAVFLLSSPAMRSWADRLVTALLGGMRLGEPPLEEHQLESMLQEALASAAHDDVLPLPSSLVLSLTPAGGQDATGGTAGPGLGVGTAHTAASSHRSAIAKAGGGVQQEPPKFQAVQELDRSVAELERLQLGVAPSWVVALIADARVLRAYSQALVFMLQLRWVRSALDGAHKSSCLAWRERETRAHPNSWKPLRSGGGAAGPCIARAPLQRTVSAGVADAAAAVATVGTGAAGGGGNVRSSSSSNGLLSGTAAVVARSQPPGASAAGNGGGGSGSGTAAAAGGSGGGLSLAAVSSRIQASLAAMVHFMATLEQWVATQLVHDAWVQFMTDLNASRNLDDVCGAHIAYTATLLRRCFRYSGEEGSRHMGAALRKCLDACLRFAAAVGSLTGGGSAKVAAGSLPNPLATRLQEEALHAASQFSYWLGYLVRFVSTRALLSPSSDLGDLLMRLNYNDCYSAHFMPEELVAQQLAAQHCATAAARGWAALGPGPNTNSNTAPGAGPGVGLSATRPGIGAAAAPSAAAGGAVTTTRMVPGRLGERGGAHGIGAGGMGLGGSPGMPTSRQYGWSGTAGAGPGTGR